jgi:ribosome-associated protein
MSEDDDDRSARQISRARQREAGERSARLASTLMKLTDAEMKRLEVDDDLREAIERARKVATHIARRRAERALAGELRRFELDAVDQQLASLRDDKPDTRQLHVAEQWRARLIEEGMAAAAELPGGGGSDPELMRLVDSAQRERRTGRPQGAARLLFRHIMQLLKAGPR